MRQTVTVMASVLIMQANSLVAVDHVVEKVFHYGYV